MGMNGDKPILQVENVDLSFGAVQALIGVSVEVYRGEILAIIGPNGAGKTSLLNVINGFYRPQQGRIVFLEKERPKNFRPYQVARQGIARTFQNVALFKGMSTLDNIMTGRTLHTRSEFFKSGAVLGDGPLEKRKRSAGRVEEVIDFLEIEADSQDAGRPPALRSTKACGAGPGAGGRAGVAVVG